MRIKRDFIMLPSLLATLILTSVSCVAEDKSGSDSKSLEGLLIGSWHSENVSDDLRMDLYWHFNDDKTAQYISKSSIEEEEPMLSFFETWAVDGNTIKTVSTSSMGKNSNEWKILKLDENTLKIEYYDKQPKRFEETFKRINKR